jgi:hypothetical protein
MPGEVLRGVTGFGGAGVRCEEAAADGTRGTIGAVAGVRAAA